MKYFQVSAIDAAKNLFPASFERYPLSQDAVSAELTELYQDSVDELTSPESSRSSSPVPDVLSQSPTSVASPRAISPPSPIARMLSKMSLFRSRTASESSSSLTSQETALPSPREIAELDNEVIRDMNRGMVMGESYTQFEHKEDNPYPLRLQSEAYFKNFFKRHHQEYPYIQGMISGTILDLVFQQEQGLYSKSFERQRLDQYLLQKVSMVYLSDEGQWMGLNLACNLHTGDWYATVSDFSEEPAKYTVLGSRVYKAYYEELENRLSSPSERDQLPVLKNILKNQCLFERLNLFEKNLFEHSENLGPAPSQEGLTANLKSIHDTCFLPFVQNTLGKDFATQKQTSYQERAKTNDDFQDLMTELSQTSSSPQLGRR
jgi:hypothetical protein